MSEPDPAAVSPTSTATPTITAPDPVDVPAPEPVESLATGDGRDWPAEAAQTIVGVIDQVRSKTTGPAITISRVIVYGLLAAFLGLAVLVLVIVSLVRLADIWLPMWFGYLILGGLFTLGGLFLWTKRSGSD